MCSGPEGNGLAPICPKSSGEEFSHCCRDFAPLHRECVSGRSMEKSHMKGAKKAEVKNN